MDQSALIKMLAKYDLFKSRVKIQNQLESTGPSLTVQWRIQDFPNGGALFCRKWGAHILFSGKKCMKLKEIGLKWGGARLLAPCYSKITIFL